MSLDGFHRSLDLQRNTLNTLVAASHEEDMRFCGARGSLPQFYVMGDTPTDAAAVERLNDQSDSALLARDIYAGAVLLVANNLLQNLAAEHGRPLGYDLCAGPIHGEPLTRILWVSGNMVRHFDEWRRDAALGRLNDRQKRSMDILTAACGFGFPIIANLAGDVLLTLWRWDYAALEREVVTAAEAIAAAAP